MKKNKLFLALLISALLVLSIALVACNSGHTLTFETNGGTALDPISFKSGQKVTPPVPTKTNFTFGGWYSDVELEVPFESFDKMPDSDVTVYAKWTVGESAKIVFETRGGSEVQTVIGVVGQPTVQPENPTKEGYVFAGWYTDEACTQFYVFGTPLASGTTILYAKWGNDSNYNYVTFYLNGSETVQPVQKTHKVSAPPKAADVECVWYKDADYTVVYDFNSEVNDSFPLYGLMYSKGLTFNGNTVTSYNGNGSYIYVPSKHDGNVITTVGNGAFASNASINYVTLPDTVTTVEKAAFYGCEYLVDVNVTGKVTAIGEFAFANCSRMVAVIDLTGITSVANSAFANCAWLTTVIFGDGLTSIGNNAFINCECLVSADVPNSVASIGDYAFAYSGITTLNVPTSLTHLGAGAVKGASNLASISGGNDNFKVDSSKGTVIQKGTGTGDGTLLLYVTTETNADKIDFEMPDGVTKIAPFAFYGNATVQNLDASGASTLSLSSFEGMKALKTLKVSDFDDENAYLAYWFGADNAKKNTSSGLYVPDSLTEVQFTAYSSTEIADYAFYGCNGLTTVKGLAKVTEIGAYAFGYTGLKTYKVESGVTKIDSTAFYGAKHLETITVDEGNTTYHDYEGALYEDTTLTYVPEAIPSLSIDPDANEIAAGALYRNRITELVVKDNITSIGLGAFENMTRLTSLTVPFIGGGTADTSYMLYVFGGKVWADEKDGTPWCDYEKCPATLSSITVTGKVTEIPKFAFAFCSHVKDIDCGDEYTSIGQAAFAQSGVTSVVIPDSVTTISDYAYFACTDVLKVVIGKGVTSIGKWAFAFLTEVESIQFQEGTNDLTIGESAFRAYSYEDSNGLENVMSSLTELKLSSNVVSIGTNAFMYVGYNGISFYNGQPVADTQATYGYLKVELSEGSRLKTIGQQAFLFSGVTTVKLPSTVISIGAQAFALCLMLTDVTVGSDGAQSNLKSIGDGAFLLCSKLESFTLYKTATAASDVPTLGGSAFYGTAVKAYVPSDSVNLYKSAWGSSDIASIQAIEEAQS